MQETTQKCQLPRLDEAIVENLLEGNLLQPHTRVAIALAWWAGLRTSEIRELQWKDISDTDISVKNRIVLICTQLNDILKKTPCQSPYVVSSGRNKKDPVSRRFLEESIRPVRNALNSPALCFQDLRYSAILRWLDSNPIEKVCCMAGVERLSLHHIARNYGQSLPVTRRVRQLNSRDIGQLSAAVEKAGDTMVTRAIYLSWFGNLMVKQMQSLTWENIDLNRGEWKTGNDDAVKIPEMLLEKLTAWHEDTPLEKYVLSGVYTDTALETSFINRRIGEFFIANGLGQLSLRWLRGEYERTGGQDLLDQKVFAYIQENEAAPVAPLAKKFGVYMEDILQSLCRIEAQGKIVYSKESHTYHMPNYRTVKERIMFCLSQFREEGYSFTTQDMADRSGVAGGSGSLINYYLRCAVSDGLAIRIGRGKYRAI